MSALVLLHGFTGHAASFQKVLARLPLQTRALCPVLLGHLGRAPEPADAADFTAEVARIADEVRDAHLGPAHLVGYSLGARVALGLLVEHAELWSHATLVSVHPGLQSPKERATRAAADEQWCELLHTRGLSEFLRAWEQQPLFHTQAQLPAAARAAQHAVRSRHHNEGLAQALRVLGLAHMPDYWPALPGISQPVRLVVGELDEKFCALAERAAGLLPRASLVRVPAVGHNVLLEAPEAFGALL